MGADEGTRTPNLRFTKPLLYQLSYIGEKEQIGSYKKGVRKQTNYAASRTSLADL